MSFLKRTWQGIRLAVRRSRLETDLKKELDFHLQMEAEQRIAQGMAPEEARRTALRDFGGVDRSTEEVRDVRGVTFWDNLVQDVRFGVRSLGRTPGYTVAAVVTLGLGIGANTAIFSVLNGVMLHPLPYRNSGQLIRISETYPLINHDEWGLSIPEVWDYRKALTTVDDVVEYHQMSFILLDHGVANRVTTGVVSSSYFETFGVKPLFGRTFEVSDDALGADPVLVLSNAFWLKHFGGDRWVIGRHVEMNDKVHTIVGILPPIPGYPSADDIYMPTSACPFRAKAEETVSKNRRAFSALVAFARLRPGISLERANSDIRRVSETFSGSHPGVYRSAFTGFQAHAVSLDQEITEDVRPVLWTLLATTGLILLIACANVANLSLSRTLRRDRELALRTALGARRTRLVRQLITENTVVALVGGLLGLALAWGTSGLLASFAGLFTPRAIDASIDGLVLLFALLVSIATGIGFGAIPAMSARPAVASALKDVVAQRRDARRGMRLRSILVVAQVAVGFSLVTGAGLFLNSLWKLYTANLGYQHADGVLSADICCNFTRQNDPVKALPIYAAILERAKAIPGARAVAITDGVPLSDIAPADVAVHIAGQPDVDAARGPRADVRVASEDYFSLLGIPVLDGRAFTSADAATAPHVAVINQTMSRLWGSRDPIGTKITVGLPIEDGEASPTFTVVGIVGDVREFGIDNPAQAVLYAPVQQSAPFKFQAQLLIRADGDPLRLASSVRAVVQTVDPQVPVENVRTLEDLRESKLMEPRLGAVLLALFASLALVITLAGLGAVIATAVSQRTREFGVRMALGASRRSVLGLVVQEGAWMLGGGLALGLAGALTFGHVLAPVLYQTTTTDPVVYAVVAGLFVLTGLAACLGPARRAISIDPLLALRFE